MRHSDRCGGRRHGNEDRDDPGSGEPELKHEAEALLKALGLSATDAITMFYRQVTLRRGLPFDVRLPNAETVEALQQTETGEGLIDCAGGLDELRARFG